MTPALIHEIARRTGLDAGALGRARERLEREPAVQIAYVFGSRGRGNHRPHSDVDIAVVTSAPQDTAWHFTVESDLQSLLGKPVDLVILGGAGPDLEWAARRDGILAINRDEDLRVRTHWLALVEYADTEPVRRFRDQAIERWAGITS